MALRAMLLLTLMIAAAHAEEILANPGFETPFEEIRIGDGAKTSITGAVADGWQDNSGWAEVTVRYARIDAGAYEGESAQRITSEHIASGSVQLVQPALQLQEGRAYRARVSVRSAEGVPLRMQLRAPAAPWTTYASRTLRTGPEWIDYELIFTARETAPVLFMLMPQDVGTVDVDAASFEAVELDADAPPEVGNLLATGRMVGGIANGWAPSAQDADEFVGQAPLRSAGDMVRYGRPESRRKPYTHVTIAGSAGDQISLYSPPVVVNPGRTHTVSLDLRSDPPGGKAWLTLHDTRHDRSGIHRAQDVTGRWQRYAFSGELPVVEGNAFSLRICALSRGELHVRNVQIVEGEGPEEFEPTHPIEFAVLPQSPNGLYFDGEAPTLDVTYSSPPPKGAVVRWQIHDLYGHVEKWDEEFKADPVGTLFVQSISLGKLSTPRGLFRVEGQVFDPLGLPVSNLTQCVFARVPRPRYAERLMPASPFGVHIPLSEDHARLAMNLGFKWCRIHDASMITKWPAVELQRGRFVYHDTRVETARRHGLMVLGMLDGSPDWASDVPDELGGYFRRYFIPTDLDAWANYCRTVATHYRGSIDHWEVWNEPWVRSFFRKMEDGEMVHGTPEDYVQLLKLAYPAVKEANPGAVVVGIDSHFPDWTRECLVAGAAGSMDVFSFHEYTERLAGRVDGPPVALAAAHRALLAQHGLGNLPVWHTEGGPNDDRSTFYRDLDPLAESDGRPEAVWHVRYYLAAMSGGVEKVFLYTLHSYPRTGGHRFTRLEPGGYLKPWAVAQANMAWHLQGRRFVHRLERADGLVGLLFEGEGERVAVLYATGQSAATPSLADVDAEDIYGNPVELMEVGKSPVYVSGPGVDAAVGAFQAPRASPVA